MSRKLIIFDFDETLANRHLYSIFGNSPDFDLPGLVAHHNSLATPADLKNLKESYPYFGQVLADPWGRKVYLQNYKNFRDTLADLGPEGFAERYFNDFKETKKLFDTFIKQGYVIAVASFGYKKMIPLFLENSYNMGKTIIHPENILASDGLGPESISEEFCEPNTKYQGGRICKNGMIDKLMKQNGFEPKDVIFFDDDEKNVKEALRVWGHEGLTAHQNGKSRLTPGLIAQVVKESVSRDMLKGSRGGRRTSRRSTRGRSRFSRRRRSRSSRSSRRRRSHSSRRRRSHSSRRRRARHSRRRSARHSRRRSARHSRRRSIRRSRSSRRRRSRS